MQCTAIEQASTQAAIANAATGHLNADANAGGNELNAVAAPQWNDGEPGAGVELAASATSRVSSHLRS